MIANTQTISRKRNPRGSAYLLVVQIAMITALVGLTGVALGRIRLRTSNRETDFAIAQENARSALDRALETVRTSGGFWRMALGGIAFSSNKSFNGGQMQVAAVDPVDGDIPNGASDPVILTGIGTKGDATYMLEVTLDPSGTSAAVRPGSWRRVVQ